MEQRLYAGRSIKIATLRQKKKFERLRTACTSDPENRCMSLGENMATAKAKVTAKVKNIAGARRRARRT